MKINPGSSFFNIFINILKDINLSKSNLLNKLIYFSIKLDENFTKNLEFFSISIKTLICPIISFILSSFLGKTNNSRSIISYLVVEYFINKSVFSVIT